MPNNPLCIINLSGDEGLTMGKIYYTVTPYFIDDVAVIINDNDERHELLGNEYLVFENHTHHEEVKKAIRYIKDEIDAGNVKSDLDEDEFNHGLNTPASLLLELQDQWHLKENHCGKILDNFNLE